MVGLVEGKVVLVTGAATGIGAAAAEVFAEEGAAAITLIDIEANALRTTAKTVEAHGVEVRAVTADVADAGAVDSFVEAAVSQFGRIDCAFNCAGVIGPVAALTSYSDESWLRVLNVNLSGVFYCMRAELRTMLEQRSGSIVNVASGSVLQAPAGLSAYVASKEGVIGLTKVAAGEFGEANIRVNVILPGAIQSNMMTASPEHAAASKRLVEGVPLRRLGVPREAGNLAAWLASDRASFVTGSSFLIDGGEHSVLPSYSLPGGVLPNKPAEPGQGRR
jgi:NAD(P)-dependent dehydrogenase (short-subunit alcohol dehydrogenase family)